MNAERLVVVCLLGMLLFFVGAAARAVPPQGATVFLSDSGGRLYALRVDPVAGWPILFPVGPQATGAYTSIVAGPDGAIYACDPCDGKILRVSYPDFSVQVVYDSYAQPACVCTEEVCDPYAGWLNPVDVGVAADGTLYFVTAGKKCVLTGDESQGVWRISPGDTQARPEEVLPGTLFGSTGGTEVPLTLAFVQTGSLSGEMVLTGLRGASGAGSVWTAGPPDFALPSAYPHSPSAAPSHVSVLPDGDLLWTVPGNPAVHRTDVVSGTVSDLRTPYGADAVAFTCDRRGNLYLLTHASSRSRLVILDPSGTVIYEQGLVFVPVAIAVLDHP